MVPVPEYVSAVRLKFPRLSWVAIVEPLLPAVPMVSVSCALVVKEARAMNIPSNPLIVMVVFFISE